MNLLNIFISVLKAIGLVIAVGLMNIPLFWSFSGFLKNLADLLSF